MIRALVFDFDGLILDTEASDLRTWREIFARHSCELPLDAWSACVGTSRDTFDPIGYLERAAGCAVDRDATQAEWRRVFLEYVAAEVPRPGVVEYLEDARRLGLRLGVASSASRGWVLGHLTRLGLAERFDEIRCRDDAGGAVKPDPTVYRVALEALEVGAHEAIAFEDSPNGVLAAKRAEIFCVAVPNDVTRPLPLDHADLRVESLADVRLEALLTAIAAL